MLLANCLNVISVCQCWTEAPDTQRPKSHSGALTSEFVFWDHCDILRVNIGSFFGGGFFLLL